MRWSARSSKTWSSPSMLAPETRRNRRSFQSLSPQKRTPAVSDRTKPEEREDFSPGPPAFPPPCLARRGKPQDTSQARGNLIVGLGSLTSPTPTAYLSASIPDAKGILELLRDFCVAARPRPSAAGPQAAQSIRPTARPWPDRP